ncbi:MAG: tetratricopeptide repeat protein [Geminicoccaceae bacterium]
MRISALMVLTLLAACAQQKSDTVTVCNSEGCVEQSKDTVTREPNPAITDPDPEGRLAELEALAVEDPSAAFDLGLRYYRGDGIRRNSYQAIQWMRDAAERGETDAQSALGRLYLTGLEEMGQDLRESEKWLSLAAAGGDEDAGELLDEVRELREDERAWERRYPYWYGVTYGYWYRAPLYHWRWHPSGRWYAY